MQEYRCTEIKDRNGNYLTVNYDWLGHITTITDTLSRVITFNYDTNANPVSITQTWNGQTHTWGDVWLEYAQHAAGFLRDFSGGDLQRRDDPCADAGGIR